VTVAKLTGIDAFAVAARSSAALAIASHAVAISLKTAAGTLFAEIATAVRGRHGQVHCSLYIEVEFEQ
jgi:hypothetical protein